jgi:hypothetical protein
MTTLSNRRCLHVRVFLARRVMVLEPVRRNVDFVFQRQPFALRNPNLPVRLYVRLRSLRVRAVHRASSDAVQFDASAARRNIQGVRPGVAVFKLPAKSGEGAAAAV